MKIVRNICYSKRTSVTHIFTQEMWFFRLCSKLRAQHNTSLDLFLAVKETRYCKLRWNHLMVFVFFAQLLGPTFTVHGTTLDMKSAKITTRQKQITMISIQEKHEQQQNFIIFTILYSLRLILLAHKIKFT